MFCAKAGFAFLRPRGASPPVGRGADLGRGGRRRVRTGFAIVFLLFSIKIYLSSVVRIPRWHDLPEGLQGHRREDLQHADKESHTLSGRK